MKNAKPFLLLIFILVVLLTFVRGYYLDNITSLPELIGYSLAYILIPLIIGGAVAGIDKARGKLNWNKTLIVFASVWLFFAIIDVFYRISHG